MTLFSLEKVSFDSTLSGIIAADFQRFLPLALKPLDSHSGSYRLSISFQRAKLSTDADKINFHFVDPVMTMACGRYMLIREMLAADRRGARSLFLQRMQGFFQEDRAKIFLATLFEAVSSSLDAQIPSTVAPRQGACQFRL